MSNIQKIQVDSTIQNLNKARFTGTLNSYPLTFFKIINESIIQFDEYLTLEQRQDLESFAICVQSNSPTICNYKVDYGDITGILSNRAPIITDISINFNADYYEIITSIITSTFTDADGDSYYSIWIESLPIYGSLEFNGNQVLVGQEILISSLITKGIETGLRYTRSEDHSTELIDSFDFRLSDDNSNKLFSNMANFEINIEQIVNQPPTTAGGFTINVDYNTQTVLTDTMFLEGYTDVENNDPLYIKITTHPEGIITIKGLEQSPSYDIIILWTDIVNGSVTYSTPTGEPWYTSGDTDGFLYSVSDVGSQEYTTGGIAVINVAAHENQPPDEVGDGEITVTEGAAPYEFTSNDFTLNTVPPYSDPEGDVANKLKITVLPLTGTLKLDGVDVIAEDIIDFTGTPSIANGDLTYTQAVDAGGTIPSFTFEIADLGSGEFFGGN